MKPSYTNDRKAPRMKKGKYTKQVITRQLYKEFIKKHPDYVDMTWDEFYKNWQDIAYTIRQEAIFNPLGVKLGSYNGEIKLQYLPHNFAAYNMDQKVIEEVGGQIKHQNIVTKGKVAKVKWERRWAVKFNKMLQFFAFDPVREMEEMAKNHLTDVPEKVRMARNTLGGYSIWRQLKGNIQNGK